MRKYKSRPAKLVEHIRNGLVEQEHYGFVLRWGKDGVIEKIGDDDDYPFYLRSCAKPLQASLIIDYGLDDYLSLSPQEIALCCASHAGEPVHVEIAQGLMRKLGLPESVLKCGLHKPISKTEKEKLIRSGESENIFQNNCIGKHIMMLGLCKMNGWDIETYDEPTHPLQQAIMGKITTITTIQPFNHSTIQLTKDGCGVPIMSMPLSNMLQGYLNLFLDPKYEKIKNAFLNHPYIIGGEDRLDTKIMTSIPLNKGGCPEGTGGICNHSNGLIAKVGAGGLCIVVNPQVEEAFIVKISDSDMKAREIAVADYLKKLCWAGVNDIEISREIKTLHGEVIGEIQTNL